MSHTFEKLTAILTEQYKVDQSLIAPDSTLSSLGLDSLTLMEFVFSAEDAFSLRIPENRLGDNLQEVTLAKIAMEIEQIQARGVV